MKSKKSNKYTLIEWLAVKAISASFLVPTLKKVGAKMTSFLGDKRSIRMNTPGSLVDDFHSEGACEFDFLDAVKPTYRADDVTNFPFGRMINFNFG
ncbi:hypothetical protein PQO03_04190 [Lentisphaera profundi]|uniref:Uncharacterized protein n=1 Tax=Lentisphaera profundi TaxID=1658616 RepID=A0ABY7VSH6_9BACT|nr:hypothetical protein [Lentisphaera profundi]WDE97155.1 hypothetical protein PQO03_04190 [Lentisphaera profundi]